MNEIEQMFFKAMRKIISEHYPEDCLRVSVDFWSVEFWYNRDDSTENDIRASMRIQKGTMMVDFSFFIRPQWKVKNYRVDFMLSAYNPLFEECYIAIEIDGHEWHEKTKHQVVRDKQRERDLLAQDFPVMRFTGSEVYHDPDLCAKECLTVLAGRLCVKLEENNNYEIGGY